MREYEQVYVLCMTDGAYMIKKIDNIPVNYIEAGEGDAVLLLHGWGANITLYQGIIDTLKRTRRVIALEIGRASCRERV